MGAKYSAPVQTGPEAHSAFPHNRYRVSFVGAKRPGRGGSYPPLSSTEVKESIQLYLTPPLGLYGQLKSEVRLYLYHSADSIVKVQINHQPDATIFQFIILTFIYSSTCFGRFPAHHQELSDCSSISGPTTNTARLSPRYEGKTRGCHCSH